MSDEFVPIVRKHNEVEGPDGKPLYSLILDEETLRAMLGGWGPADQNSINSWLHSRELEEVMDADRYSVFRKILDLLKDE